MKYAYDKALEINVSAGNYRPSRLADCRLFCPCCGERVIYVKESRGLKDRRAHFKHWNGTYREECEFYSSSWGQPIYYQNSGIRKFKNYCGIRLIKKNNNYSFVLGVKFKDDDLAKSEAADKELIIVYSTGGAGLVRNCYPISRQYFVPNKEQHIELKRACEIIRFELGNDKFNIEFINGATFFHILNESDWEDNILSAKRLDKAKSQSEEVSLYIGQKYFLVVPSHYYVGSDFKLIKKGLLGCDLYAIELVNVSNAVKDFCGKLGYSISNSPEKLITLWPPVEDQDEDLIVHNDNIYVKTNFDLVCGQTISFPAIKANGYYKLESSRDIIIDSGHLHKKYIRATVNEEVIDEMPQTEIINNCQSYELTKGAYLFSENGVATIEDNIKVYLSFKDSLRFYKSNYLRKIVRNELNLYESSDWITPILRYSKVEESFQPEDLQYCGYNAYVKSYLIQCRRKKSINSVIKRLLEEGKYD